MTNSLNISNPFRPGAGHLPPYLAGRQKETKEFCKLLLQTQILENTVITGLRGVGKTVLLENLKPEAIKAGWVWLGTDLSESATISHKSLATRILADISAITSKVLISKKTTSSIGFISNALTEDKFLDFDTLQSVYNSTPGLPEDKLKACLELTWRIISSTPSIQGIIFAYDEAQNLSDQADKDEYPLSTLLDVFQSIQRKNIPMMLVLSGLPTLFPKLVESRAYAERMFRVLFLKNLSKAESRKAISKPLKGHEVQLNDESIGSIIEMSGGYPYFIQFICREVYDAFLQKIGDGGRASVPRIEIEKKLDSDFFAGRWARATDRQRDLLKVIAKTESCDDEFTVQEISTKSKEISIKAFSPSHITQMLLKLCEQGLVFKNRHGKYSFAVPLLGGYINRQVENELLDSL